MIRPLIAAFGALSILGAVACAPPQEAPPVLPPGGWSIAPQGDLNALFDCLAENGASLVAAHRGGPAPGYPENALPTMARTLGHAPAILEIDVAASADGVLFLLHDETLERTTTGAGPARDASWRDISRLRLKDADGKATAFRPTALAEALDWAKGRTILKLDIKRSASYEAVAEAVARHGAEDRVILIAYTIAQAQKLHRLMPDVMISLNISSMSDLNTAIAQGLPAGRLIGFTGTEAPDARLFGILQQRGVEADFGTLGRDGVDREIARSGDEARYAQIAAQGADILSTDRPVEADAALRIAGRAAEGGACGITKISK